MSAFEQLSRILGWPRKRGDHARVGIYLTATHVWLVALGGERTGVRILAQASEPMDPERWPDALPGVIARVAPRGASLHVVLAPSFYSLVLVDAPQVPPEELQEAARWRIRDLVPEPIDTLVVDVFALPEDAFRGRVHMIYAAATAKALVQRISALHSERYPLESISVQELALLRTGTRIPGLARGGLALLSMEGQAGGMHLCENGSLYLSRAVDFSVRDAGTDVPSSDARADRLALDVQRSLDYYESQIGKNAPQRLLWFGSETLGDPLIQLLQARVAVDCIAADLEKICVWPEPAAPEHQVCWAAALGAALPEEEAHGHAAH